MLDDLFVWNMFHAISTDPRNAKKCKNNQCQCKTQKESTKNCQSIYAVRSVSFEINTVEFFEFLQMNFDDVY